ncbi:Exocyst complex component SEC6 [Smittium mucronatum]|uniref:Exocyst complex component SEC6 n=1 Tax=Smittium mucronatum TaxID=133383 RepID=A0A1R0H8A6_9FUNG|nr:Exocyst complex component SEC6 [Smittium mucronatum]
MKNDNSSLNSEIRLYAIQRLAKLLKHPDDLQFKLDGIKSKLTQEKMLIDAQLSADVQRQFDDVQEGLDLLFMTEEQIDKVKNEMKKVDKLCNDAQGFLSNYDRIKRISIAHKNFEQTELFYQKFRSFNQQCEEVSNMLRDANENIEKFDFNLLIMHYQINKLESFRKQAISLTENSEEDVKMTLSEVFLDFENLSQAFEFFIWQVASKLYDLGANQKYNIIVQLLKVIEVEENNDAAIIRERDQKAMEASRGIISSLPFKPIIGGKVSKSDLKLKNYKKKFIETIQKIIKGRMHEFFTEVIMDDDEISKTTELVIDDLLFVAENIIPCVPPSYSLFDVFLSQYHLTVVEKVNELSQSDMDGRSILNILSLARQYQSQMRKDLGIPKEKLQPPLLEGREEALMEEYLDLVRTKISEWISNLMTTETKEFLERPKPPETGENNHYVMQGSIIMFEIVNQQVDLAIESNRGKLVCDVVLECNKIFAVTNKKWKLLLETESKKQIENPEEVAEGLVDYIMSLANDQLRCVEFSEAIQTRLCDQLSRVYQEKLSTELGSAMEGFMDVAQRSVSALSDIVFSDLRPIFAALYTADWYQQDLLQPVIETLRDYCLDFRDHLHEFLFMRLIQELLERYVISYIDAISNKGARFSKNSKNSAASKLKKELEVSIEFFSEYLEIGAVKEVTNALTMVISLIDSTPTMLFLEYFSIKKQYPDVSLGLVEDILNKREDVDFSQSRNILDSLRAKTNNEQPIIGARQTVFSKLKNY